MNAAMIAYFITLVVCIPLVFWILTSLHFESKFEQGKIVQIRIAYIIATLVISHLLAHMIYMLYSIFVGLF